MLIKCSNCNKTFEIDEKLIPDIGRLLQCSKCDHQWFYNKEKFKETTKKQEINLQQNADVELNLEKKIKIKKSDQVESNILIKPENDNDDDKIIISNKKEQKNNFLKTFLVFIISFVALIIIVDTFKIQIKTFYPGIDDLLNSLYQTLTDINLFFKDLIN